MRIFKIIISVIILLSGIYFLSQRDYYFTKSVLQGSQIFVIQGTYRPYPFRISIEEFTHNDLVIEKLVTTPHFSVLQKIKLLLGDATLTQELLTSPWYFSQCFYKNKEYIKNGSLQMKLQPENFIVRFSGKGVVFPVDTLSGDLQYSLIHEKIERGSVVLKRENQLLTLAIMQHDSIIEWHVASKRFMLSPWVDGSFSGDGHGEIDIQDIMKWYSFKINVILHSLNLDNILKKHFSKNYLLEAGISLPLDSVTFRVIAESTDPQVIDLKKMELESSHFMVSSKGELYPQAQKVTLHLLGRIEKEDKRYLSKELQNMLINSTDGDGLFDFSVKGGKDDFTVELSSTMVESIFSSLNSIEF